MYAVAHHIWTYCGFVVFTLTCRFSFPLFILAAVRALPIIEARVMTKREQLIRRHKRIRNKVSLRDQFLFFVFPPISSLFRDIKSRLSPFSLSLF